MAKILIADALSEKGLNILRKEKDITVDVNIGLTAAELKKVIGNYEGIIVRSGTKLTADILSNAANLKVIGRAGVGLDNVDVEAASKYGIIVMNAPGGNTMSTAEHTMSMILALSRNIPQANETLKNGKWDRKRFMGVEIYGKTLGIIGLGRIGTEVAIRALSFGMNIIAYDPFLSKERAKELKVELVDLKTLFNKSDYITIHTPLTSETKNIITEKEFKLMKKGVKIINCARGGLINEKALADALRNEIVGGAALDVFDEEPAENNPLLKFDNLIATPHLGASTKEAQVNVAVDIAIQVRDAITGRAIRNAVNVPCMDSQMCKVIEPYIPLAEKLGSLQSQLVAGHINQVHIKYSGEIGNYDTASLTIAVIKGILTPMMGEGVNYVNALVIAKERKIKITESKSQDDEGYTNYISVEIKTDKVTGSALGTLFTASDPRIVRINEFHVDAIPSGYMLVISNKDVPGIVGGIGTILGESKINIAGMNFGREKRGGRAVTVLNIDSVIPDEVMQKIKKEPNIIDAKLITL